MVFLLISLNKLHYDHSRVKLQPDQEGSDYINANFVPGFNSPREFIATQGRSKLCTDTKKTFATLIYCLFVFKINILHIYCGRHKRHDSNLALGFRGVSGFLKVGGKL